MTLFVLIVLSFASMYSVLVCQDFSLLLVCPFFTFKINRLIFFNKLFFLSFCRWYFWECHHACSN